MKNLNLIIVTLIFMLATSVLADPGLVVVPGEHHFGEVELGSSSTTIITIENIELTESYLIDAVSLISGSSSAFSIKSAPAPGTELPPGESADVEVSFEPSALGYASATLQISWANGGSGVNNVSLDGTGVAIQPPPPTIQDILDFFDQSVADGTLVGSGPGKSAEKKLNALRNMIEAAGDLIDDGFIADACQQLLVAYKKTDALPRPPDFVAGPAAPELAAMIQNLRTSLEETVLLAGTGSDERVSLPRAFSLSQNYPNPFNPSTTINYEVPEGGKIFTRLSVFNLRCQVVKTLVNEIKGPGRYIVHWDGTDEKDRKVSSGVYLYRMQAGEFTQTRKMVILK